MPSPVQHYDLAPARLIGLHGCAGRSFWLARSVPRVGIPTRGVAGAAIGLAQGAALAEAGDQQQLVQ